MNKGSKEDLEKFFLIAWGLLYRRNQRIHKERELKPEQVIEDVLSLQKVHNEAQGKPKQLNQLKCFWVQLPPPGAMKLNADGLFFIINTKAGIWIILRDAKDDVIMSVNKKENELNDLTETELLAMFTGLQLCVPLGRLYVLILESEYSLLMVKELQAGGDSLSLLGNLIQEIKDLVKNVQLYRVQHTGRLRNESAHRLAKHAWNVKDNTIWWNSFLDIISQVMWTYKHVMFA